jgi:hypothetical protein
MPSAPAAFRPRRFSDPVSDLNADIHDQARMLSAAVEMVDKLGIRIIAVEADRARNRRIQVAYGPECHALDAIEVARDAAWSHWCANRFGVEIRWCIPVEAA